MAVGFPAKTTYATGDVLTATDVNDITGTLNLLQSTLYPAGRNKIINGDFGVWQRGTSFSTTVDMYTADRFYLQRNNTNTISRQTFTPGTAPVSGYEGQYFLRYARTTVGGGNDFLYQRIENVQTYAGQTVAVSFWAKADTAITIGAVQIDQIFGGGGSADVTVTAIGTLAVTTGWVRYSATVAIPSIAGKTIGTNSNLRVRINFTGAAVTFDTWGWQLEAASTGSTASPFQTASGSIGGELALCQRYYYRNTQTGVGIPITNTGGSLTTTLAECVSKLPVTMRASGIALETLSIGWYNYANTTVYSTGTWTLTAAQPDYITIRYTHGSAIFTAGQVGTIVSNANPSYIGFSAEL